MPFEINLLEAGTGGLDRDNDYSRVKKGDYPDALDVRSVTSDGQTSYAVEDIKGNKHIFTLPTVVRQNKLIRIFLNVDVDTTITLSIRDSNGLVATAVAATTTNMTTGLANLSTAILTALGLTGNTVTVTQNISGGYAEVEITTILGKEWSITGVYGTGDSVTIVTVQEAIDASIAGGLKIIGGRDLLGDLFIYSTSQSNLPSQISIASITQSGTLFLVTTTTPHGAQTGYEITVQEAESAPTILSNANGKWIINVLSPTTFELLGSVWDANAVGGTVTVNGHGLGEIGVSQFNFTTNTATYTTLIRSKKFNFNTLKQIDCNHKKTNVQFDLKWTDDFNVPRVLYYRGAFVTNGAIEILNPLGLYSYDTLEEETRLFVKIPSIQLDFTQQFQTGGAVQSGNWRYAVRLLTESLTTSEPTKLTNPINVYTADFTGDPKLIAGNAPDVVTTKINELTVTGIPLGVFQFIELIGVNYVGGSMVGYLIRRDVVGDSDTQVIRHTGTETLQDFDLGQLNFKSAAYSTFKNIDRIENRLVLSNGTSPLETDFSNWAHNIQYLLQITVLPDSVGSVAGITAGEYQNPENVNVTVGYMHNETYRFGIEVQYKDSGVWSSGFHIADITFDKSGASGQRLQGLTTFALTSVSFTEPLPIISYVQFTNIDPDFILSDGRRVGDVISAFRIVRAEVVPEVLACGMLHMGMQRGTSLGVYSFPAYKGQEAINDYAASSFQISTVASGDFSFSFDIKRKFGAFYSFDVLSGNSTIQGHVGTVLRVIGQPVRVNGTGYYISTSVPEEVKNEFTEYNGWFSNANPFAGDYVDFDLDDLQNVPRGGSVAMGGDTYTLNPTLVIALPSLIQWQDQKAIVVHSTTDITGTFEGLDGGHYYTQIFRAISDKYGDQRLTKYVGTGQFSEITELSTASDTYNVFGGDTFVQKTYFHHRYFAAAGTPTLDGGYGGGYSFYSQNRTNSQMRDGSVGVFPRSEASTTPISNAVANWLQDTDESFSYNRGYNIRNDIQIDSAFDVLQQQQTDLPTIFIYSEAHPENSLVDMERVFLPLNFKYADNIYGEVFHHANINGELLCWQADAFSDMYFNPSAIISTQDGSEVITGTGAVMARPQRVLSTYGCQNKWSVAKWLSNGGKDIVGWVDKKRKALMRYGYDGTVPIFERHNIKSFLANNLTDPPDTPAHGEGISAVYHQRYGDVIWTVRNPSFNQNYSLVWNEKENVFKAFYTAKPKIALSWYDFYIAADPDNETNVYQADAGNYLEFFGVQSQGYIELLLNHDHPNQKHYLASMFESQIIPFRVDYRTKQHQTFVLASETETNNDMYSHPINVDTTVTGDPHGDSSWLFGNYLRAKVIFEPLIYQKLTSVIVKYLTFHRPFRK